MTRYFLNLVSKRNRNLAWGDISIVLTDNAEIRRINGKYLGHSEITDVISFRYSPLPGGKNLSGAEIIVNAERAFEESDPGPRAGTGKRWSASRELALYIAHGCDHLTDEKDDTPAGRARMRRRELRWLRGIETKHGILESLMEAYSC